MPAGSSAILYISLLLCFGLGPVASAQPPTDWDKAGAEAVRRFERYLSINTSNPPGDVSGAAAFYREALEGAGIPVRLIWTDRDSGRVNVLARLRGSGKKRPLMLLNHMDTVPVDPTGWSVDPFSGIRKDGYIYGRGALDMKNFGITQLMSMILLKRRGIQLDRDVVFVGVADEEVSGELGSGWIAENLWHEIDAEYVLDEGGFGTEGFFTRDERLIVSVGVAEKQVLWLRLSTTGTEGHGSMPPAENANFIMARALGRVAAYKTPTRITPVVAEMMARLGELDETPYNNALQRNTISLTVMKGYVGDPPKSNVIPARAEAVLDCRLLPGQDPAAFVADLRRVIDDARVKMDFLERPIESIVSPFDTDLFRVIEKEVQALLPEAITLPHLVIYGTDSRYFRKKGAICYGFFPGPVSMQEYRRIHGNDERIRESSLRTAVRIYFNVLKNFCGASP
ncbi:MAG: M20/M25/M40 family metallo-hydrolase [Acidobacteriota bacterium]